MEGGKHHSPALQRSWIKHGKDRFTIEILERVAIKEDLIVREQFWIDTLRAFKPTGYNVVPKAGSRLGATQPTTSQSHRDAVSRAHTGKIVSAETRAKLSAAGRGRPNPKQRGRVASAEARANMSAAQKGRQFSEATKEKMRAAKLGVRRTPEAIAAVVAAQKGLKRTAETRARMSDAQKRRFAKTNSPDHRQISLL
jgi:group I intron endonuclease